MPSEWNHIDDLFRNKEAEVKSDASLQEQHWKQMQALLKSPAGTSNAYRGWLIGGAGLLAVVFLLFILNKGLKRSSVPENPSAKEFANKPVNSLSKANDSTGAGLIFHPDSFFHFSYPVSQKQKVSIMHAGETPFMKITYPPFNNERRQFFISDLFRPQLRQPAEYVINTEKDTTLYCRDGAIVFIPAFSFSTLDGVLFKGRLLLRIHEAYDLAERLAGYLGENFEVEGHRLIGPLKIEAFHDQQPMSLAANASLQVTLPSKHADALLHPTKPEKPNVNKATTATIDYRKTIAVINLLNDPRTVKVKGNKKIGQFILSDNSLLSTEEAKEELQKRYGHLYDEIRVRKGWKPAQNPRIFTSKSGEFYSFGLIGESIQLPLGTAAEFGLLSAADILQHGLNFSHASSFETELPADENNRDHHANSFHVNRLNWVPSYPLKGISTKNFILETGAGVNVDPLKTILYFPGRKAVFSGRADGEKIYFENVPAGEKASLICVGIQEGELVYFIRQMAFLPERLDTLQFTKTNPASLIEAIRQICK